MNLPLWLDAVFLGNPLSDWAIAMGWGVSATGAMVLARRVAARRLARLAALTKTVADDALVEAVRSVRKSYAMLIVFGIALSWLQFPTAVHKTIQTIVIIIAVLQGIRSGNAIVDFWVSSYAARHDAFDPTTLRALGTAGRGVLWVTVVLVGLEASGFEVKTLLAGLGVGGIAIALAMQNILGDLFAALSIVLDKPFVVGDAIAVDQFEGDVVHIGLKSTRVRSVNGEEVVFSNADLLKSRLRNLTRRDARRYVITLLLAPGTTAVQAARVPVLVAEAVAGEGGCTLQRSHVRAIGATGIEVESAVLIAGTDLFLALDTRQRVLLGILERLEREQITLARYAFVLPGETAGRLA